MFLVHGFRGVTERIERMAKSLGLRVTYPAVIDHLVRTCLVDSEHFRVDISLDSGGTVKDVRIKHTTDQHGSTVRRRHEALYVVSLH